MKPPNPFPVFARWFRQARDLGIQVPEAMCLSTVSDAGRPEGRIVLLKSFDPSGFVFYTDTRSVKGRSLKVHPHASLTFHWGKRQVRVEGRAVAVTRIEADAYFATRPRESRLAAWASRQSRTLGDRAALCRRFNVMKQRFRGGPVPRPPYWSGFRVVPDAIEYWRCRPHRLHDRWLFARLNSGRWRLTRLYP